MDSTQIKEILDLHKLWLEGKEGGKRADLQNAYLQKADLQNADLWNANLWNANLQDAYLQNANLQNAYLQYADLRGAIGLSAEIQEKIRGNPYAKITENEVAKTEVLLSIDVLDTLKLGATIRLTTSSESQLFLVQGRLRLKKGLVLRPLHSSGMYGDPVTFDYATLKSYVVELVPECSLPPFKFAQNLEIGCEDQYDLL